MEHPWSFNQHDVKLLLQASHTDMKQRPIPVVIIELAEILGAQMDFVPNLSRKCHSHVMF